NSSGGFSGPTLILGPKGSFLFANAVEYEDAKSRDANDQKSAENSDLGEREEYVMWGFSGGRSSAYLRVWKRLAPKI
ncbi:MAG TPA: hypothetical protein VN939_10135, partial [Chthoniobacterales bacterium]|nr:hypothetical protein [Chthoniobacterales bacterium]